MLDDIASMDSHNATLKLFGDMMAILIDDCASTKPPGQLRGFGSLRLISRCTLTFVIGSLDYQKAHRRSPGGNNVVKKLEVGYCIVEG